MARWATLTAVPLQRKGDCAGAKQRAKVLEIPPVPAHCPPPYAALSAPKVEPAVQCLVYLPHSYTGRGPAESCVRAVAEFPAQGLATHLFLARARQPVPGGVVVHQSLGPLLRQLPWRYVRGIAIRRLQRRFAAAIRQAPTGSIAYFWPDAPVDLVRLARECGLITVREMINGPMSIAKDLLDAAYARAGLPPSHTISAQAARQEDGEILLYDRVFASNPEVERGLVAIGVDPQRILATTFGWAAARFGADQGAARDGQRFRLGYVGTLNVRKGVPDMLAAWARAGSPGELWLAGAVEPLLQPMVAEALAADPSIRHFGHVDNVAAFYRQCDAFIFPTHEEGGPQVTYEAASCGLPVITTPMGAARLVEHGRTGLVVPPGDPAALASAIGQLAANPPLRRQMGAAAAAAAPGFEYARVGAQRARLLLALGA